MSREIIKAGNYYDLVVSDEPTYKELQNHKRVFQIINRKYDVVVAEGVHEVQAYSVLIGQDDAMLEYMESGINKIMDQITGDDLDPEVH